MRICSQREERPWYRVEEDVVLIPERVGRVVVGVALVFETAFSEPCSSVLAD